MHVVVEVTYRYKGHTMGSMRAQLNLKSATKAEAKAHLERTTGKDIEIIEVRQK